MLDQIWFDLKQKASLIAKGCPSLALIGVCPLPIGDCYDRGGFAARPAADDMLSAWVSISCGFSQHSLCSPSGSEAKDGPE